MKNYEALVTAVTGVAIAISEGKSIQELSLLTAVFMQLGQTLATISVSRSNLDSAQNDASVIFEEL